MTLLPAPFKERAAVKSQVPIRRKESRLTLATGILPRSSGRVMTRKGLRSGSAGARRLVDPSAPQHGVDEPDQLSGGQDERSPMLVADGLAELLLVVGTELLRTLQSYRVGRLDEVVAQVLIAGLGQRPLLPLELPGLVAPPGESPANLAKDSSLSKRLTSPTSAMIPAVKTGPNPGTLCNKV